LTGFPDPPETPSTMTEDDFLDAIANAPDDLLIGDRGVTALASSPNLAWLTRLGLNRNKIGDAGARALAASPYLTRLAELDLWANEIGKRGRRALKHLGARVRLE
jgi:hypothetical protein